MVAILRPPSASLATDSELATEQEAREDADTALTQAIADEASERANADTALSTSVAEKVSKAANLSDLVDVEEARGNLGLGDAATQDAMDLPVSDTQGVALDLATAKRLNIFAYGAIADGDDHPLSERYGSLPAAQLVYPDVVGLALTDQIDWAAGQQTIHDLEAQGGGVMELPPLDAGAGEAYVINKPWEQRYRSLIKGAGPSSLVRTIGTGDILGNIFQWGMHHPAHYPDFTYYSLAAVAAGTAQVTFSTPAQAANFTVGQVVLIRSVEHEIQNTFQKPFFVELNRVAAVDAVTGIVKLAHSFDEAVATPQITDLSGGTFTGVPTFIADTCGVEDVGVDANQNWIGRNASFECWARNVHVVRSLGMVLGNAFGRCHLEKIYGNFTHAFAELATGAHHSTFRSIWGTFKDEGRNVSAVSLIKIGEHPRHNVFEDYRIYAGDYTGNFALRIQCRKNYLRKGIVIANVTSTGVYLEGTSAAYAGADLTADSEVTGTKFYLTGIARFLDINSPLTTDTHMPKRNVVARNEFYGSPSVEAFRGNVGQQNRVLDNYFQNGAGRMASTYTANTFRGSIASWAGTVANLGLNKVEVSPYRTAADIIKVDDKLEIALAPTTATQAARKQEVDAEATSRTTAIETHRSTAVHDQPQPPIIGAGATQAVAGNDARLTDQRVPTDSSVTNAKVAPGAGIEQSKIDGLTAALAGKEAVGVAAGLDAPLSTRISVLEADTNWVLPTLATDVTVNASWGHLGYRLIGKTVWIAHALDIASPAANKLLYTLPAAYWIKADGAKPFVASLISGPIRIYSNGEVRLHTAVALSTGLTSYPVGG